MILREQLSCIETGQCVDSSCKLFVCLPRPMLLCGGEEPGGSTTTPWQISPLCLKLSLGLRQFSSVNVHILTELGVVCLCSCVCVWSLSLPYHHHPGLSPSLPPLLVKFPLQTAWTMQALPHPPPLPLLCQLYIDVSHKYIFVLDILLFLHGIAGKRSHGPEVGKLSDS